MRRIRTVLGRFLREEQGAEGLEKLLIIAAIMLPLLGLLLLFKDRISEMVNTWWDRVKDPAMTAPPSPAPVP